MNVRDDDREASQHRSQRPQDALRKPAAKGAASGRPGAVDVDVVKAVRAPVSPEFVRRVLKAAVKVPEVAARMPRERATVAVRITDARELRRLNGSYADEDYATDVLSFEGVWPHLGDIAVSWDAMVSQGLDYGHPPQTELALMCVHGLLHLLRWDHYEDAERDEMWRLTLAGLKRAGVRLSDLRL